MFVQKLKQVLLGTLAAGAVFVAAGVSDANALPLNPLFAPGSNLLSDNSAEYLINVGTPASTVDVNDRLRGIASFNTLENGTAPPGGYGLGLSSPNDELTVLFDLTVSYKTTIGLAMSNGGTCLNAFCFEFIGTPGFAPPGFGAVAGGALAFYEDATHNFDRGLTGAGAIATMEGLATDGTPFWFLGLGPATDFWAAGSTTDNITLAGTLTSFGAFNFGISVLANGIGPTNLGTLSCFDPTSPLITNQNVQFCGNGQLLGKGLTASAYDTFDDVNVEFILVPEPATLSFFGMGLLGLGDRKSVV